jgi:hypothetical protein
MNDGDEPDLVMFLKIIQNAIDTTHLILKYVTETHKAGKSLDYVLPLLEEHVRRLDRLSGPAKKETAIAFVKDAVDNLKEVH